MNPIPHALIALLLLGLPALVAADPASDAGSGIAQCAEVSARFHDNPRGLSIGDLDALRSCINRQQDVLRAELRQASGERRVARASLHDDF